MCCIFHASQFKLYLICSKKHSHNPPPPKKGGEGIKNIFKCSLHEYFSHIHGHNCHNSKVGRVRNVQGKSTFRRISMKINLSHTILSPLHSIFDFNWFFSLTKVFYNTEKIVQWSVYAQPLLLKTTMVYQLQAAS